MAWQTSGKYGVIASASEKHQHHGKNGSISMAKKAAINKRHKPAWHRAAASSKIKHGESGESIGDK